MIERARPDATVLNVSLQGKQAAVW